MVNKVKVLLQNDYFEAAPFYRMDDWPYENVRFKRENVRQIDVGHFPVRI